MGTNFIEDELLKRSSLGILTPMCDGDIIQTSILPMTTSADPALNAAVSTAIIDVYGGVIITLTGAGNAQTLQDPTSVTAGKNFTVVSDNGNGAHTIEVNGITLSASEAQRFIWDGSAWISVTAVDADDITLTPTGDIVATNVQDGIAELDTEKVAKATFNANTILAATTDDTPAALTVAANTLVGRGVSGNIDDMDVGAQSFTNLLENGDFESWSAGASAAPDGWTFNQAGAGGSVARTVDTKIATYVARVTKSDSGHSRIQYQVGEYPRYASRTVTFGVWMKSANTVSNQVKVQVYDGVGNVNVYYQNSGDYEWITATLDMDASANQMIITCENAATSDATADFVGAMLVEGSVCPAFSPKPLADDGRTLEIDSANNAIKTDTINEHTSAAGVTVDGVVMKDNGVSASGAIISNAQAKVENNTVIFQNVAAQSFLVAKRNAANSGVGLTLQTQNGSDADTNRIYITSGVNTAATTFTNTSVDMDNTLSVDTINEHTADTGVTVDGVLCKDYIVIEPPSSDTAITAVGGITVTRKIMRVAGSGGAIDITANPQIAAGTDGQIVIIQGTHDTNTVKLDNGAGLALSASITLAANDNITLMYDSGETVWIETSRTTVA